MPSLLHKGLRLTVLCLLAIYTAQNVNAQIITTIAGTGIGGYTGNNGPATVAQLEHPVGVALDGVGNVYIADFINQAVRKVNASGIISVYAGSLLTSGFGGDGGPATAGML